MTWFNPGSGTGYVFAVSHVLVLGVLAAAAVLIQRDLGVPAPTFVRTQQTESLLMLVVLLTGYYIAYVGLSRLLVLLIPGRDRYGLPLPTLINVTLLALGCAVPFFFESWRQGFVRIEYSAYQATNWMWTLTDLLDSRSADPLVITVVALGALAILVINLMLARGEIESVRMEAPDRVKLDDETQNRQDMANPDMASAELS